MKKLSFFSLLAIIFSLNACKMAEVILPRNADNVQAYDVEGKRKIRWKGQISFGNYQAQETKKSFNWSSETSISLYNKQRSRHEYQFEMKNTKANTTYEVFAMHSINQSNLDQLRDIIDIIKDTSQVENFTLNEKDYFVGAIKSLKTEDVWDFQVSDASAISVRNATGFIRNGDQLIRVREVTEVDNGWLPTGAGEPLVFGFYFEEAGKHLATVRVYHNGKVWIEEGLSGEKEDVVAAMSAALLLKKTE